jgi:peptidoglycan/xylan/chitin deacetylase (PgdA/CDA1 family)
MNIDRHFFYHILISFFLVQLLISNCWAEDLKTNVKTPLYHIYISFDDGPLWGSEDIDDAIKSERIKINVFVVGSNVHIPYLRKYFQLYANNPYIEIGNHSYSHAHNDYRFFYENPESVYQDFLKNERELQLKLKLARLPGRNMWRIGKRAINDVNSGSLAADLLSKNGYTVFGWDLEWRHDSRTGVPIQTVSDIFHQIEDKLEGRKTVTENHVVILCHDEMFNKKWEETELKKLIECLKKSGLYEFNHLSEYPGYIKIIEQQKN